MAGQELAERRVIEDIIKQRDKALAAYIRAAEAIQEGNDAFMRACSRDYGPLEVPDFRMLCHNGDRRHTADFTGKVTRKIDRRIWDRLLALSGLETLMDATAREAFERQLETDPPPVTLDNVVATFFKNAAEARTIFERGLVTTFQQLDRSFKSHSAFKIGRKIILTNALMPNGTWNWHWRRDTHLADVERTLLILDDGKQPENRYAGIIGAIDNAFKAKQRTASTPHIHVRMYQNGNIHVSFIRPDLIDAANRIIAKHYGETLAQGN